MSVQTDLSVLKPEQVGLLMVDFQNDFCRSLPTGPPNTVANAKVAHRANAFAANAMEIGIKVIYTQQELDVSKLSRRQRIWGEQESLCKAGSTGAELFLAPVPGSTVVKKHRFDIWQAPEFERLLQEQAIEGVIIAGVELRCCVLYAVLGAEERGYRYVVPQDLVSGTDGDRAVPSIRHYFEVVHNSVPHAQNILDQWAR